MGDELEISKTLQALEVLTLSKLPVCFRNSCSEDDLAYMVITRLVFTNLETWYTYRNSVFGVMWLSPTERGIIRDNRLSAVYDCGALA